MPYKAFEKGLICLGKQYQENTVFEESGTSICKKGVMHYCENPLDIFDFYPLIKMDKNLIEFAEVEPLGEIYREKNKCATNKLHIESKLSLQDFIEVCIDFILDKTKQTEYLQIGNGKNDERICVRDYHARIGNKGDYVKIISDGDDTCIYNSGCNTHLVSCGDSATICNNGDIADIITSGGCIYIGNTGLSTYINDNGFYTYINNSGDYVKINSNGPGTAIVSTGKCSTIIAIGKNSIVKAKTGSWITLAEWSWVNTMMKPKCVKTEYVDGERIKEDVFYKLENGEFKEEKRWV